MATKKKPAAAPKADKAAQFAGKGPIKVIATKRGYYGQLREEGDTFEIESAEHLGSWMKPADNKHKVTGKVVEPEEAEEEEEGGGTGDETVI